MALVAELDLGVRVADRTERFYVNMAAAFVATAFIGFVPTYWGPMVRGTLDVPPITHLHAALFYGWTLLFWRQTSLVASRQVARHREWGLLGVAVATAMFFVGMGAAFHSIRLGDATDHGAAGRAFAIVPISIALQFIVMFAIAVVNVKKPEVHKRLLIVATASLLQAAIGRMFALVLAPPIPEGGGSLPPPPVAVALGPGLVADLFIVAAMVHDYRTRGRVHRVYWIAGASVLAVQLLRVPVSATAIWAQTVEWMLGFAP
jgi:hypothetical protein